MARSISRHEAAFHIVIMPKGWARFMYEDKETLVEAGDCVHQRPGIVHYLFDYSPDMEYLEIVGPADFEIVDVDRAVRGARAVALEVLSRARSAQRAGSELHVEFFDLLGFLLRGGDPLLHLGHRHDGLAIGGAGRVELDVVGEEARDHRRVHRVGHAALLAEQVRAAIGGQAVAPDLDDAFDVGLRARPDLVARESALQVHRQRRAQVGKAGVHLAADRAAMRARRAVGRQQAGLRADLVQVLGDGQRVPDLDAVVRQAGHAGSTAPAAASPCARRRRRATTITR